MKSFLSVLKGLFFVIVLTKCLNAGEIQVFPDVAYQVNGYSNIQRIFGGDVNGTSGDKAIKEIQALNLNCARAYLWPGTNPPPPITSWRAAQFGGKPTASTKEETFRLWDQYFQQDFSKTLDDWYKNNLYTNSQAYQLVLFKKWGLTEGLVFHPDAFLDGSADRHPEAINRYFRAYIETIHKFAPELKIDFIQLQNEPNYPWWSGQFETTKESVETWIRVFNRLDEYLKKNIPETRLLGPCLASDTFFSWKGWNDWTVPVLSQTSAPEYFNYHAYDISAATHLNWIEMLQAKGEALRGKRPLGIITETNWTKENQNQERFQWENEQLFMCLAHPDKIALRTYFLLAYPDAFNDVNMLTMKNGKLVPNDVYWIYWVLANTRGKILHVNNPANPQLKICASSPQTNQVVVSIFNDSQTEKQIVLNPGLEKFGRALKITQRYAAYQNGTVLHEEKELPPNTNPISLELLPFGVYSLTWTLENQITAPARTIKETEFYSPDTAVKIKEGTTISIKGAHLPKSTDLVYLRLGINTDDTLLAQELNFSFNEKKRKVFWSDVPKQIEETLNVPNTWWVEIPLPRQQVKLNNTVSFNNQDAEYKLMFASLVYKEQINESYATRMEQNLPKQILFSGSLKIPAQRMLGETTTPIEILIKNESGEEMVFNLTAELPAGLTISGIDFKKKYPVKAKTAMTIPGVLNSKPTEKIKTETIKISITDKNDVARYFTRYITAYPKIEAVYFTTPPVLNGNLDDWKKVPGVPFKTNGLETETKLGWDDKNMYAAITVRGKFKPNPPDTLANLWIKDSIELFIDLENTKDNNLDANELQVYVSPVGIDNPQPFGARVIREANQTEAKAKTVAEPGFKVASSVGQTGYILECRFPWELLSPNFRARRGKEIGLDVAIDHAQNTDGITVYSSILGAEGKPFSRPDKWGIVTLKGGEAQ